MVGHSPHVKVVWCVCTDLEVECDSLACVQGVHNYIIYSGELEKAILPAKLKVKHHSACTVPQLDGTRTISHSHLPLALCSEAAAFDAPSMHEALTPSALGEMGVETFIAPTTHGLPNIAVFLHQLTTMESQVGSNEFSWVLTVQQIIGPTMLSDKVSCAAQPQDINRCKQSTSLPFTGKWCTTAFVRMVWHS